MNRISKRRRLLNTIVLCIAPVFIIVLAMLLKQHVGPYWLGSNTDPEYAYLLNSLNITQHKLIAHIDHPGTTLQVLGAAVIVILHLTRHGQPLLYDVLKFPEIYLSAINLTLVIVIAVSVFLVGVFTLSLTKNIAYALILQCTPFFSVTLLNVLYRVSPEPMLLCILLWFSYFVLYAYYHKNNTDFGTTVFLSITTGFALVTKITAIPLIFVPLAFLSIKNKLLYFVMTLSSFIFFTLPISERYGQFADWVYRLMLNTGTYGTGDPLIINMNSFSQNLILITTSQKYLSAMVIILVLLLLVTAFRKNNRAYRFSFILGLLVFFISQIFMVSKYYVAHYLVPSLGLLGISTVLLLIIIKQRFPRAYAKVMIATCSILFAVALYNIIVTVQTTRGVSSEYTKALDMKRFIKNTYPGSTTVTYYHSSSPVYALWFGSYFASNFYSKELTKIYSRQYFYDIWDDRFYNWSSDPIPMPTEGTVLFQGQPIIKTKLSVGLKDVYGGEPTGETVYAAM